uniref:VirB4, Type IV secretion n=1 Tax=Vibrio sp. 23023 TaxID=452803 RepID=A9M4M4_9VIBR|nr:VirB4 family type IV secretion system protein [Vibrio sp. 23023]ABX77035.1 VirB4, Type IV secretion [Vibrio sp. 23023]
MTALNESIYVYGACGQHMISDKGDIIGALSLDGIEPNTLSPIEREVITSVLRNVLNKLPFKATLTQYYIHHHRRPQPAPTHSNPRVDLVLSRRHHYLNTKRTLNHSHLFWLLSIEKENAGHWSRDLFMRCMNALFDKKARETLKMELSNRHSVLLASDQIKKQLEAVTKSLDDIQLRLTFLSANNHMLSANENFQLAKTLVTLNPDYLLHSSKEEGALPSRWDRVLAQGNVSPIVIDGIHYLKIEGPTPRYARIATITGCGEGYLPEAAFCSADPIPVCEQGNYLFMTRYHLYSRSEKDKMIRSKEDELYRSEMKVTDFLNNTSSAANIAHRVHNDPNKRQWLEELNNASNHPDRWGRFQSYVVVFDEHLDALNERVTHLHRVLENAHFHLIWESIGLLDSYSALQIGYPNTPLRAAEINATQAAAMGLFFRGSEGLPRFSLHGQDVDSLYTFESNDGLPFHYTPYVGDKCLVIGVGPTRSGKTFLKNCIATHFQKLGGLYTAMDVDAGTEPIARFFGEDAAVFRLKDATNTHGFNPFAIAFGEHDDAFKNHMNQLIRLMLETNDAPELRVLTASEQLELDSAIVKTLRIEARQLQTLTGMLNQCSESVRQKLKRFMQGGPHGHLFDNETDAIGILDKPFSVYNIEGVKDNPSLATLVNTEIFFRCTRLFEDPHYRTRAKFLEVDECQYVLSIPNSAEYLIAKARTWFKHGGGMGFWTQSPTHYSALPEWGTLRSAATTFIFMSDPEMQKEEYLHAFPFLSEDECHLIQSLTPKRQAYIKQISEGIAKVVNLFVENEQYVIATSRPHEADIAQRCYQQEPDVDKAIAMILDTLNLEATCTQHDTT